MNTSNVIHKLWRLGHFHNGKHPTGVDFTEPDEVLGLSLKDDRVQKAVLSYMEFFPYDLDLLVSKHHGRPKAKLDGDAGPAFMELMEQPRCDFPDYLAAGKQEANWPKGCRGKLKFGRDFNDAPGLNKKDTDKAFWAACNNWTQALSDLVMSSMEVGDTAVDIYAKLKALRGSTLAWSYLAQNSCNVTLDQRYNTKVDWTIVYLATVATHEIGHAIGLPHNRDRDALMYPSIHQRSLGRIGYPNKTDLNQAKGLGYKLSGKDQMPEDKLYFPRSNDPDDPDKPDDPDGPREPNEYWFEGYFTLKKGDEPIDDFILSPRPKG